MRKYIKFSIIVGLFVWSGCSEEEPAPVQALIDELQISTLSPFIFESNSDVVSWNGVKVGNNNNSLILAEYWTNKEGDNEFLSGATEKANFIYGGVNLNSYLKNRTFLESGGYGVLIKSRAANLDRENVASGNVFSNNTSGSSLIR